jgi:glutathione S-transferase
VPEILAENIKSLSANLDVYDTILGRQQYMAGDEFSMVDIFFVPYTNRTFKMGLGNMVTDRPHLKMWWETVSSRPSLKKWST